jgi:hypothetical protein
MSWYSKEKPTPFDKLPIDGLTFLDGDLLASVFLREWIKGKKCPVIEFPSGFIADIRESLDPQNLIIELFGELEFLYKQSRNDAFAYASKIAKELGYVVKKIGKDKLELQGYEDEEHFLISYHTALKYITDIQRLPPSEKNRAKHPAHVLMNDEIRKSLPPLYSNEDKGLEAIAPIKYFHALSGWRWHPTEYDPENRLFFGLVAGYEIELGYFSLDELEEIGKDKRSIPIERDLYYEPKSLKELGDMYRKERGEL